MLKKTLLVMVASFFLTVITYQLPFMVGQKIELGPVSNITQPEEIADLLKKEEISESEFQELKQYSELVGRPPVNVDQHREKVSRIIREGTIYWMAIVWALFFIFLPSSILEYVLATIVPSLYFGVGLLLDIELVIIVGLAIAVLAIKQARQQSNGE